MPAAGSGKHTHLNGGPGLVNVAGNGHGGRRLRARLGRVRRRQHRADGRNLACQPALRDVDDAGGQQENLPINCVNWYEAYAFCIWDGGFLPSEAEWEYAAAGGSQQREYPWGSSGPGDGEPVRHLRLRLPERRRRARACANIAPVGTPMRGAGVWGQLDLAGERGRVEPRLVRQLRRPVRRLRVPDGHCGPSVPGRPLRRHSVDPDAGIPLRQHPDEPRPSHRASLR